ncbi:MAG: SDR family NAD(P)-dependent oxidoreductase [Archangiaceae bacterium]|nr:SDR family NAD(P)-dependent oxidoreductase [Archangiaceae bacterium]
MKAAILGATKGMGRSLARLMVERGDQLVLLGREPVELQRSAADLQARGGAGSRVHHFRCDLAEPETFAPALDDAEAALKGLDAVIITAGLFATQDELEADARLNQSVLTVDFTNTVLFCEEARKRLLARGGGTLCVFSSVAGDRGRKPVVLYGAAKAGLSAYLEGLDHRFRSKGLKTVCVKPGFVRTAMTEHLKAPPIASEPDEVAPVILEGLDRGTPIVYAPPIWRWVMTAVKSLPRFAMRRVGF